MSKMIWFFAFFVFGVLVGYFEPQEKLWPYRTLSSVDKKDPFDLIECPGHDGFQALLERIHFSTDELNVDCTNEDITKLVKTLLVAERIKFNLPSTWPAFVREDLSDILSYFSKNTNETVFNKSQAESMAYNEVQKRKIHLGTKMFIEGPLEALMTLFHEARHSVSGVSAHVVCSKGDMTGSQACDPEFSFDGENAGSYTYSVLLYFSLAFYSGDFLTEAEREWALDSGMSMLSARFEKLPAALAEYHDILALIDSQNKIYFYNINEDTLEEYKYQIPNNEKVKRVAFGSYTGALAFFTHEGFVYGSNFYEPKGKIFPFIKRAIRADGMKPILMERIFVLYENYNQYVFYSEDRKLKYALFEPASGEYSLKDYPLVNLKNERADVPDLKLFFPALLNEAMFLTQDGRIWKAAQYASEPPLMAPKNLQNSNWIYGTGGVLSNGLYLIDKAGKLRSFKVVYEDVPNNPEYQEKVIVENQEHVETPGSLLEYHQGMDSEAYLTEKHQVFIRKNGSRPQDFKRIPTDSLSKIQNILMLRKVVSHLQDKRKGQ